MYTVFLAGEIQSNFIREIGLRSSCAMTARPPCVARRSREHPTTTSKIPSGTFPTGILPHGDYNRRIFMCFSGLYFTFLRATYPFGEYPPIRVRERGPRAHDDVLTG